MPSISLEDHFISEALRTSDAAASLGLHMFPQKILGQLLDIGDGRVADLDEGNVTLQVVSSIPCVETPDVCRRTNIQLAEAVKENPTRLAGFATLPMADAGAAASELEHSVRELGFSGALIPCHAAGVYYDGESYLTFWEKVQELDAVVYIHPTPPSPLLREYYAGNYPPDLAQLMGQQAWGWHTDVAVHVIRLYASGLFDKFPKLKVVIGHMGEALPFMADRVEAMLRLYWGTRQRDWWAVWKENLWFTTSYFSLNAMSCLLRTVSPDRVMYSIDYPYVTNVEGKQFLQDLKASGMVTDEDFEKITYRNAERLLGIQLSQ